MDIEQLGRNEFFILNASETSFKIRRSKCGVASETEIVYFHSSKIDWHIGDRVKEFVHGLILKGKNNNDQPKSFRILLTFFNGTTQLKLLLQFLLKEKF